MIQSRKRAAYFFDGIAPFYEKIIWGARKTFSIFNKEFGFEKNDRVLDLGGGTGRVAKFLPPLVQKVVVADASVKMVKQCQKHKGLKCLVAKAERIPFSDNYFDKVIITDAFHHFQNQNKVCQEINRTLKPGGKVIIQEYNPKKLLGWLIVKMENLLRLNSRFFAPSSLKELFEKNQFKTKLIKQNQATYYLVAEKLLTQV